MQIDNLKNKHFLPHVVAKMAGIFGILDEKKYRDLCIREEYERMKSEGMKNEKIEIALSQKFSSKKFPLSPETIHDIYYRNRN